MYDIVRHTCIALRKGLLAVKKRRSLRKRKLLSRSVSLTLRSRSKQMLLSISLRDAQRQILSSVSARQMLLHTRLLKRLRLRSMVSRNSIPRPQKS